jgi:feruloyl esterase
LQPFKAKGGKMIMYHGWSDPLVPGTESTNYYESVVARMGREETQSFLRLYMAPGMHHGFMGPGPNFFGQVELYGLGGRVDLSIPRDPQHNISTALEEWVEEGKAPEAIIATKYVNDFDPTQGIKMTRPLCPYPQFAKYKGTGDTNDATNFVCTQTNSEIRALF